MNYVYKVVGNKVELFDTVEELLGKYKQIGVVTSTSVRKELQGQPRLEGLAGAMYDGLQDGRPVIRYETQEAYNMLSV